MALGGNGIVEEETSEDPRIQASSIEKFSVRSHTVENPFLASNFKSLSAQLRAKDETELDLARENGNHALYGNVELSLKHGHC